MKKKYHILASRFHVVVLCMIIFIGLVGLGCFLFYYPPPFLKKRILLFHLKDSHQMIGMPKADIVDLFHTPQYQQTMGQTTIIQYRSDQCVMIIYLSAESATSSLKISKKISLLDRKTLKENSLCLKDFTKEYHRK